MAEESVAKRVEEIRLKIETWYGWCLAWRARHRSGRNELLHRVEFVEAELWRVDNLLRLPMTFGRTQEDTVQVIEGILVQIEDMAKTLQPESEAV
jgi:hypothetical protein